MIELDGNCSPNTLFQQLISKLESFTLQRAVPPQRLLNPDEEELPDEIETVWFVLKKKHSPKYDSFGSLTFYA